jgi:hypothetical protein
MKNFLELSSQKTFEFLDDFPHFKAGMSGFSWSTKRCRGMLIPMKKKSINIPTISVLASINLNILSKIA